MTMYLEVFKFAALLRVSINVENITGLGSSFALGLDFGPEIETCNELEIQGLRITQTSDIIPSHPISLSFNSQLTVTDQTETYSIQIGDPAISLDKDYAFLVVDTNQTVYITIAEDEGAAGIDKNSEYIRLKIDDFASSFSGLSCSGSGCGHITASSAIDVVNDNNHVIKIPILSNFLPGESIELAVNFSSFNEVNEKREVYLSANGEESDDDYLDQTSQTLRIGDIYVSSLYHNMFITTDSPNNSFHDIEIKENDTVAVIQPGDIITINHDNDDMEYSTYSIVDTLGNPLDDFDNRGNLVWRRRLSVAHRSFDGMSECTLQPCEAGLHSRNSQ